MKQRGSEIVSKYQRGDSSVPQRTTRGTAGYGFQTAEAVVVPGLRKSQQAGENPKPILVRTGIKAYMPDSKYLELASHSLNPLKRLLLLTNGVEVIDSDYYSNEDSEGHIMLQFLSFGYEDVVVEKGERIGQGIFRPFLLVDGDQVEAERTDSFGSSRRK